MIVKEFTRQAPMVLTEEQRWCLQRDSEGKPGQSMSGLVRDAIDVKYGLEKGRFPEGDPRAAKMAEDPLPVPEKK